MCYEGFSAFVLKIITFGSEESFNSLSDFSQLYKLPGGNQVDGLPPAASWARLEETIFWRPKPSEIEIVKSSHIRFENPEFSP